MSVRVISQNIEKEYLTTFCNLKSSCVIHGFHNWTSQFNWVHQKPEAKPVFSTSLGECVWKKIDKMHPWELECVFMSQTIIFILCNWINNFYFVMVWPRLNPNFYLFQFFECSGFQNCGVIYCINNYAKKISEIDLENDNLMAKPTYHANYIHKHITCCNNVFTYVSRTYPIAVRFCRWINWNRPMIPQKDLQLGDYNSYKKTFARWFMKDF